MIRASSPRTQQPSRFLPALALLLSLAVPLPLLATEVAPFVAHYEVSRNGSRLGEATLTLSKEGRDWSFVNQILGTQGLAALGGVKITETSKFGYRNGEVETRQYTYVQESRFNNRRRSAQVDREGRRIVATDRDDVSELPYSTGVVDRQLLTIALMQAVASGETGPQPFTVVGRRNVEPQTWQIGSVEPVPQSNEKGWRIERIRESADGRSTTLWLDQDQGHLPLRIEQREDDGSSLELRLVKRG